MRPETKDKASRRLTKQECALGMNQQVSNQRAGIQWLMQPAEDQASSLEPTTFK